MSLLVRIMSKHILLHKKKSKIQKPKQVPNGRLKPLKKQVSKYLHQSWENLRKPSANLLSINALKRNIRACLWENTLPNPQTGEKIPVLPQECQFTTNGHQFLVFDSGIGNLDKIFTFASDHGLQCLFECDHWYPNGTFKNAKESFHVFFGLLPNKT